MEYFAEDVDSPPWRMCLSIRGHELGDRDEVKYRNKLGVESESSLSAVARSCGMPCWRREYVKRGRAQQEVVNGWGDLERAVEGEKQDGCV